MNCPNCGLQITDPQLPSCPRCGQALHASTPGQQAQGGMPTYPGYGAQPSTPPPYGASPTTPSGFGDQAQTPYPGASYGQPPAGQQPVGAQPGYPSYGQPAAPSTPYYGQPAAPSTPYYGQGAPAGYPAPQLGYPMPQQPPKRKRNLGLIIGIPVAIVIVLCVGGFAALAYIGSRIPDTSTTSPSATSTPSNLLFHDALTKSSHEDGWPDDGNCTFSSDGYHVKGSYLCYSPANDVSDGSISVQAALVTGSTSRDYGIVFRRTSRGNYYVFAILSSGKWDFYKAVNDSASNVVDPKSDSAIKTGLNTTNTLKVTMKGSHFTFFVNGVQVGTADDSSFTSGKSGVAGADNIDAVFTDYQITK